MDTDSFQIRPPNHPLTLAGIDGCRGGWVAVFGSVAVHSPGALLPPRMQAGVFTKLEDALAEFGPRFLASIDMPIGLPEFITGAGRGPEQCVRPHLGDRQSSVFSIPSRSAVHAPDWQAACLQAMATSDPPKKISRQAFNLFPRIRELDVTVRTLESGGLRGDRQIFECHPEFAFAVINGGRAMSLPKKIRGRVNPDGMAERSNCLAHFGFRQDFLEDTLPGLRGRGVARDDFLDACACLAVSTRLLSGEARPHPRDFDRDAMGNPVAIWA